MLLGLVLAGCWEAPTPLMASADRDLAPLSGRYEKSRSAERETIDISRLPDRRLSVVRSRNGTKVESFTASLDSADDLAPTSIGKDARIYIVETDSAEDSDSGTNYSLIMLDRNDVSAAEFVHLKPSCSKAAKRIARVNPDAGCRFTSYRDVRIAAADLLTWLEDPRISPEADIYTRPKTKK